MIARALMLDSKFVFADELLRSFNVNNKDIFFIKSLSHFNMGLFMIYHKDRFNKYSSIEKV